jgi:RNA polymerase sigma-70 factor (ECF subfamily)
VNFDTLANQHKDAVYRHMIRICGNREDAEDVLIEALMKAYRSLEQLREVAAFRTWLVRIASRICWQLKQKEALMPLVQLSALEDEGRQIAGAGESIDLQVAARQTKQILAQAIASLPPAYREVYELRDVEELRGEEVARRLGITVAAMKSRLNRARSMIREYLDRALTSGNFRELPEVELRQSRP